MRESGDTRSAFFLIGKGRIRSRELIDFPLLIAEFRLIKIHNFNWFGTVGKEICIIQGVLEIVHN